MIDGMPEEFDFDLFVIGGGSGGVRAARIAASEGGARVALAEESRMGGTCVIRGCVPKKLMVFAGAYPAQIEDARAYGWDVSFGSFDWPRFRTQLEAELTRLEGAYRGGLATAGVTVFDTRATVVGAHDVQLADGRKISAKHILIATGGRPFVPDIAGSELAITSNEMFHLPALPARALVVGAGYIACEFASLLAGLGVAVTLAYRAPHILRGFDFEARDHLTAALTARGLDLRAQTEVRKLSRSAGGILADLSTGEVIETDLVLYATGRIPNAQGLGLEALGVEIGARGQVVVDDYSQTAVPSIFAVGDVTDRINLTPVAIREGHAFADTVFGGVPTKADYTMVASAVFTTPELASVGLTEEQAAKTGPCAVYTAAFRPMKTLFAGRGDKMLMKLIVAQDTGRVLGCHIVGEGAGEMMQMAAVAVKMGATKADFDATVAIHPTAAEELVTLRKPARIIGA
jgi:glutathione reductase (NADPH)